jgi:hypothetical protein
MATPFCTICESLGGFDGQLCCEVFLFGIPGGMEEIVKRRAELSK